MRKGCSAKYLRAKLLIDTRSTKKKGKKSEFTTITCDVRTNKGIGWIAINVMGSIQMLQNTTEENKRKENIPVCKKNKSFQHVVFLTQHTEDLSSGFHDELRQTLVLAGELLVFPQCYL